MIFEVNRNPTFQNEKSIDTIGNVQTALKGRRLYLNNVTKNDEARFTCVVRNTAGEARKNYNLFVHC